MEDRTAVRRALRAVAALPPPDWSQVKRCSPGGRVQAIEYDNVPAGGRPTRVFAYLGMPAEASCAQRVPAVALVHGGGGTAYSEWAADWAERGFAALAMDFDGKRPDGTRDGLGGPPFDSLQDVSAPIAEQWMFHAVSAALRGMALLRSDPRVAPEQTGLMGISWGGVVVSLALGITRPAFAVAAYGGGFQRASLGRAGRLVGPRAAELWDAGGDWLEGADTPTLWVNSDADCYYSLNMTTLCKNRLRGSHASIWNNLAHNYPPVWGLSEPLWFAQAALAGQDPYVTVLDEPRSATGREGRVAFRVPAGAALQKVRVYGCRAPYAYHETEDLPAIDEPFAELDVDLRQEKGALRFVLPEDVGAYYVQFTTVDERGRRYRAASDLVVRKGETI